MRKKKLLCIILSIFMVINLLPVGVMAETPKECEVNSYAELWDTINSILTSGSQNYNYVINLVENAGKEGVYDITTPIVINKDFNITINMNGVTINGNDKYSFIEVSNGANVTITDGIITNTYNKAISVYASGDGLNPTTVTLENCVITNASGYGLYVGGDGGGLSITVDSNSKISATTAIDGTTAYGIYVSNSTSCTDSDIITVNGDVTSADTGIALNGYIDMIVNGSVSGATAIDVKAGSLTITGGTITGTTADVAASSRGTILITGGTFSSDVSEYLAAGYMLDSYYTVVVDPSSAVAQVGSSYYASLEDAFAAVASTSGTVTLLKDVTLNNTLEVALDDNTYVTLELNGHTITFAYDSEGKFNGETPTDGVWGLKLVSGNLTIMDSTDDETGGIKTADVNTYVDPVGATGSSKLYILNGNYSTNSIYEAVVFANDSATVYIWGGTFTNSATSYAYRSDFSGIILNIGNNSNATITASSGTFIGEDPASGDDHTQSVTTFVDSDCVSILEGSAYIVGTESDVTITSTNGTVTTNPSGSAVSGQTVTITITPDQGYEFASITVENSDYQPVDNFTMVTYGETYTFTMPEGEALITVTYRPVSTYTVTVDPKTGGTAYASVQTANEGDTVTITTLPDSGYTVSSITGVDNIVTVIDNSTYTFTMPAADVTVTVTFAAQSQSSGKGEIGGIIYVNEEYHGILLTKNGRRHLLCIPHTVGEDGCCTVCKEYIGLAEEEVELGESAEE